MNYIDALEKAVLHIEDNLETVTGEQAASVAGYSYYHFTRVFAAVLGESVGSYIRTRRLSDSARKLIYTDERIIDIALENGFESPEAFSRAFKATYRITPAEYRKNRLDVVATKKPPLDKTALRHYAEGITVKPEMVEMDEVKIAGLRGRTSLKDNVIPQLWQQFWQMSSTIPNTKKGSRYFGISEIEESADITSMNEDVIFTEMVGVEVTSFDGMPSGMAIATVEKGRYAVFTHKGTLEHLPRTYNYIWGSWIFSSGAELGPCGDFELYDERFKGPDDPTSEIDIYVRVK